MSASLRVLIVSRDEMLLRTREMILGGFFEVSGAGRVSEARALLAGAPFDLIVLCHSLSEDESQQIIELVAALDNKPRILAMSGPGDEPDKPWADTQLRNDAGPYGLLKKCAEMLDLTLKSKARVHA